MNVIKELNKFNHIKYLDEPHHYYIGDVRMTSATTFIGEFKEKFDSPKWSKKKAKERGITVEEILAEWDYKREFSCEKGSALHDYAENLLNNKIFPYPEERIKRILGEDNLVKPAFDKLCGMFNKFHDDIKDKMFPVKSEFIVGDEEFGICGMIDQLFWNEAKGVYQIWDWKTNKAIKTSNRWQRFKNPISHLDECELNTYSLQTSLYRLILERNTNLTLGDSYIVWFFEENQTYEVFKCWDFRDAILEMIEYKKSMKG